MLDLMNFTDPQSYSTSPRSSKQPLSAQHDASKGDESASQLGAVGGVPSSKHNTLNSGGDFGDSDEFDTDLEDGEGSGDEAPTKKAPRVAPTQLFMEFLDSVMKQEWPLAKKLCQMILIYEPTHKEALEFQPVIEEKIQIAEAKANASSSSSEEDSDDDSDDDSDSDDSDDSNDEEDKDSKADGDEDCKENRHQAIVSEFTK